MLRYLARRIVLMFVALVIICTATFFLMRFLPGSPFNDKKLSNDPREQLEAKYGLDKPLGVQYATYVSNLARGDLGNSFYFEGRPVLEIILARLPISAFLSAQAVLFGLVAGLMLGVVAALRHNSVWDSVTTVLAVVCISVPSFVLAPLLQYWVGGKLGWLPIVFLVAGSLVVEQIFAIPGIGEQFIRAIVVSDYFMIMGTTIFFSVLFMLMLLLQDIIYGVIDPRMRLP